MIIPDPGGLSTGKRLRFLFNDSLLYGGAAAISKAFALITFPLLARHFSVADYGLIDLFSVSATFLTNLLVFGQDAAFGRFFYEHKDESVRKNVVSQSLMFQMLAVLLALPLLLYFSSSLAGWFHPAAETELLLKVILAQIPFLIINSFSKNMLKLTFSRGQFLFMTLGSVTLNMMLLVIGIVFYDISVVGVFVVSLLVQATFSVIGILFVKRWITLSLNFYYLRELLPYAIPLGIISCAAAFVPVLERSLVDSILGGESLGLYAAGAKVAMILAIGIQAFRTAWGPFSLAIHKEGDAAHTYILVLKGFSIAMCVGVLLLSSIGNSLVSILATDRFSGAVIVVFPLALGIGIRGVGWITDVGINLSKKTYLFLISYPVYVSVTGLAIYYLAGRFGLIGVAYGVLLGQATSVILVSWIAQIVYPLNWPFGKILILVSLTGILGTSISTTLAEHFVSTDILYLFAGTFVFGFGWRYVLSKSERKKVISKLKNQKGGEKSARY